MPALAARLGLGVDVVSALEAGRIRAASAPERLLRSLGEMLDTTADQIAALLGAQPAGQSVIAAHAWRRGRRRATRLRRGCASEPGDERGSQGRLAEELMPSDGVHLDSAFARELLERQDMLQAEAWRTLDALDLAAALASNWSNGSDRQPGDGADGLARH